MTPSVGCQQKSVTSVERTEQRRFSQYPILKFIVLAAFLALTVNSLIGQTDALFIGKEGNVGIRTNTPGFPLTFPNSVGDKISLWGQNGPHFGFGINDGKLLIHVDNAGSDVLFGYGTYGAFTETMRVKGTGRVGIGASEPKSQLSVGSGFNPEGFQAVFWNNTAKTGIGFNYEGLPVIQGRSADGGTSNGNLLLNAYGGNVGIGTQKPGFPLSFPNSVGDKISLWGESGANFGFGIQHSLLQIHTNNAASDIAFGYGESDPAKFTETMRINGSGIVTIGGGLFVQGERSGTASISKNAFINTDKKWQIKDTTKKAFTMELRDSGILDLYGTKTNGQTDWRKLATFDGANNKIEFGEQVGDNKDPSNTDVIVQGKVWARGGLAFYWPFSNRGWLSIDHGGGGNAGAISASYSSAPSDLRLKSDMQPIPSALAKINRLRGVTFHWNEQGLQYLTRDIATTVSGGPGASDEENRKVQAEERNKEYKELSAVSVGVVAQDVEAVLPEAVTTDEGGYKSVKYHQLIPLMIEALKEEDRINKEQAQTIARQQGEIQRLAAATQTTQQQLTELTDLKQQLEALLTNIAKSKSVKLSSTSGNQMHPGTHSPRSE